MRIIGLTIKGVRKIAAINLKIPDKPGLIPFVGMNEQGKSTIIDCIEILFRGLTVAPKDLIKHGEKKSELLIKFGDYTVERVITKKSSSLKINDKKGGQQQKFLEKFVNLLTFNPTPFLNKTAEQKLKFIMELFGLNFTNENKKIKELTDERLLKGREIDKIGEIKFVEKVEHVDINDLFSERARIIKLNKLMQEKYVLKEKEELKKIISFNDIQKEKAKRNELEKAGLELINEKEVELQNEIDELQTQLILIQKKKKIQEDVIFNLLEPLPLKNLNVELENPKYEDIDLIETQIRETTITNQKAELYKKYLGELQDENNKKSTYNDLTAKIKEIEVGKKKKLTNINIPIEGLEIREDGIYHDGIFSENWSQSEGLRISSQLCIAMNPKLRAIFIDKGESYDRKSLKNLEKWAIKNDIQAFITIVDEIPVKLEEGVFYIKEGSIVDHEIIEKGVSEEVREAIVPLDIYDGIDKEDPNPEILLANDNDWDENDE